MTLHTPSTKILICLLASIPFVGLAQSNFSDFGPVTGEKELIVGANGGSSRDFDDSFGGVNAAVSLPVPTACSSTFDRD